MASWLDVVLYAVAALFLAELVGAAVRRWRNVIVLDRHLRHQIQIWPLRIAAAFGFLAAVALRRGHGAGRPDGWVDAVAAVCLVLSLAMVLLSWNLARKG